MSTDTPVRPKPLHPAAFSPAILDRLSGLLVQEQRQTGREITVFDPMAGIGRVHQLARPGKIVTSGMELEPEWSACHDRTVCGDSLAWMEGNDGREGFDVLLCSPPYGNRLSDSHDAKDGSVRRSYKHDLGRDLTANNGGGLPWGPRYWQFMSRFYRAMPNVLAEGGLVLWNVSDFVKDKGIVPAVMWHRGALNGAGFYEEKSALLVETARMGFGANREARAPSEVIMRLRYQP